MFRKLQWNLVEDLKHFDVGDSGARSGIWHDSEALYVENNERAVPVLLRDDLRLDHFRLRAEIACPGPAGFVGLAFGARDSHNFELVYVSPGTDFRLGEIQYDPIMNGSSTWQIYNGPRYQAPAALTPGEWAQMCVDVHPSGVAINVGETASPQLVVANLQRGHRGKIGVWGCLPSYIRNFCVEEIQPAAVNAAGADLKQLAADTFVTDWAVSKPYLHGERPEPENQWLPASVEENGTLNLNRLYTSARGTSVQAKCVFSISEETETMLTFGFSDHLRLWVNEVEVYQGQWQWDPPASDGRIRPDLAGVPVRWRAGSNTIRAEVTSQEVMFGWGLSVKTGLLNIT